MEVFFLHYILLYPIGMSKKQEVHIGELVFSEHGSLALLAQGASGLRTWRKIKAEALKKQSTVKKKNGSKK